LQSHEFIDVELRAGSYTPARDLSTPAANQRAAVNDVTTSSHHHDRDTTGATDDENNCANCCAVRLSVCCGDNDKQVSLSLVDPRSEFWGPHGERGARTYNGGLG